MSSLYVLIIVAVLLGLIGWLLFMWAVKHNQFDDIEGPKYRMLDDDDDELPKG